MSAPVTTAQRPASRGERDQRRLGSMHSCFACFYCVLCPIPAVRFLFDAHVRRPQQAAGYPPGQPPGRRVKDRYYRASKRIRRPRSARTRTVANGRLPLSICEYIIDSLGLDGDHDALRACSLVCSAWIPRTRRYLFASVTASRHRCYALVDLLRSRYCTFLRAGVEIGQLRITGDTLSEPNRAPWNVLEGTLRELARQSVHIQRLGLDVVYPFQRRNPRKLVPAGVVHLDLYISTLEFDTLAIVRVICAFSQLESLTFSSTAAPPPANSEDQLHDQESYVWYGQILPHRIHSITVSLPSHGQTADSGHDHFILQWLLDQNPKLTSMNLLFYPSTMMRDQVAQYLSRENNASRLEHFGTPVFDRDVWSSDWSQPWNATRDLGLREGFLGLLQESLLGKSSDAHSRRFPNLHSIYYMTPPSPSSFEWSGGPRGVTTASTDSKHVSPQAIVRASVAAFGKLERVMVAGPEPFYMSLRYMLRTLGFSDGGLWERPSRHCEEAEISTMFVRDN